MLTIFGLLLAGSLSRAQTSIPLSNGSFEQWSSHSGYSVSLMFLDLPIYNEFSTPADWNYLTYPVSESISFFGMTVNINTSIPLILASRDTASVPDGGSALRLQTLMVEDVVDATALSLAAGTLDSTLIQTVVPSVLSTGEIDLMAFMPLLGTLLSALDTRQTLLPLLLQMDMQDYLSGGIALNGLRPGSLTGSYHYQSAVGGDNGSVILLGTHYNDSTHRRDIVGGGYTRALTDTDAYTAFEVHYTPLWQLHPDASTEAPDSLVVLLLSSAGHNMQQGSRLYLDNLVLWSAPDTCASVAGLTLTEDSQDSFPERILEWTGSSQPDRWEVEFGPQGFEVGSGTRLELIETSLGIDTLDLLPDRWYDFYVRSVCNDSVYGEWDSLQCRTFCAAMGEIEVEEDSLAVVSGNLIEGYSLSWASDGNSRWEVEYGVADDTEADNWGVRVTVDTAFIQLPPLLPDSRYVVEVTPFCGDDNYGKSAQTVFQTMPLTDIGVVASKMLVVSPNPAHGRCMVTLTGGQPFELRLYSADGRLLQSLSSAGVSMELILPGSGVFLLQAVTADGTLSRTIVGR